MASHFRYDVFLSHSSKDKEIVRTVAERLKADGLRVWFDDWILKPGDSLLKNLDDGLEASRVLVLFMSANAFGSDWAQLEAGMFRFRDPLNKERRFIPLRLDEAPIKGSIAQFLYINWLPEAREQEYAKLFEACRPPAKLPTTEAQAARDQVEEKAIQLNYKDVNFQSDANIEAYANIQAYAFSPDGKRAISGDADKTVRVWDAEIGHCLRVLEGHSEWVSKIVWRPDQRLAISGAADKTIRVWDVETGRCLRVLQGHSQAVHSLAWSPDQRLAISGSADETIRVWDVETGRCLRVLEGHSQAVYSLAWSPDQRLAISGSADKTIRVWDVETGRCLRVLKGHTDKVYCLAWSPDQRLALSGSVDKTVRLWDVEAERYLRVLEGHTEYVWDVAWNANQRLALSSSGDKTVRLWDVVTGRCLRVLNGYTGWIPGVAWSPDQRCVFSGDNRGVIWVWDLSEFVNEVRVPKVAMTALPFVPDHVQYTNAKVLLVGESGVGKTGLSQRLALDDWGPSDSTVGAWATQLKLPVDFDDGVDREIWLWDFGGQADQRLIHQLYMDETALAALVFDGQKEDLFETLGQWDRDLTRSSRNPFTKLLVAGRVDAGGLRASRSQVEAFAKERGYAQLLETSAKANIGCEELKQAILDGIRWENIPWRSSPLLFKRLKEEIVRLKEGGRALMRFNELRETLQLRLMEAQTGEVARFTDEELKAVVGLLAGPGVVWELKFGSWILLQPERINAYAQAVIQTMRDDQHERGCLPEERVLNGNLKYHSSMARLEADEERFVLLAMHQTLVERGLCLREYTDKGALLVFPSFYRRERPDLVGHPAVLVSYRFNGFLDDIYATLVVRLHHTSPFEQDELWRYAADFKTLTGKKLGVKLTRRAEGAGELEVYFDPEIATEAKIIFSRYVHEHLLQKGRDVVRLRHYVCPHCHTPVGNREVAMERLNAWLENSPAEMSMAGKIRALVSRPEEPTIICSKCEKRVPLWDELEQCFASPEIRERVRQLQQESDLKLDNESRDRALVGEVISTVALAGQIIEEYSAKRYGLDMEIEFKDDDGKPTGKKLYLQLKSGDSHLYKPKSDGAEIFRIHHPDHAAYWMSQAFPVFLVIGNSGGEVRWMEIRDYLKRETEDGRKTLEQIVFTGERFDVMSVRRWRDKALK